MPSAKGAAPSAPDAWRKSSLKIFGEDRRGDEFTPFLFQETTLQNGGSSIGRVAVSKTVGWGFDSLPPCQKNRGAGFGVRDSGWRGGRVVDCGGLENRCAGNSTGGSNPSPSAKLGDSLLYEYNFICGSDSRGSGHIPDAGATRRVFTHFGILARDNGRTQEVHVADLGGTQRFHRCRDCFRCHIGRVDRWN